MGEYLQFHCPFCQYRDDAVGIGRGRKTPAELQLYKCTHCKTLGSTWVEEGKPARCVLCYDTDIELMSADTAFTECPKCGETLLISKKEGSWE
jgi:predicted RNA-binding Zn-ribbon protein involved in translation (DUF1610 family)